MNLSELFIRRPVMTTLVMLSLLLFGLIAYHRLPISNLPSVDFPTISVTANLPGANPEIMPLVGEDPEADAARFRRTPLGICLITQPMIDRLGE